MNWHTTRLEAVQRALDVSDETRLDEFLEQLATRAGPGFTAVEIKAEALRISEAIGPPYTVERTTAFVASECGVSLCESDQIRLL